MSISAKDIEVLGAERPGGMSTVVLTKPLADAPETVPYAATVPGRQRHVVGEKETSPGGDGEEHDVDVRKSGV